MLSAMLHREEDIAQKLVALYAEAFTTALDTPEAFLNGLIAAIKRIVSCDGLLMILEPDRTDDLGSETIAHIHFPRNPEPGETPRIETEPLTTEAGKDLLDELIARGEKDLQQVADARFPGHTAIHTYWFRTERRPRIAGCIFRAQRPEQPAGKFTASELGTLDVCERHIALCLRVHGELNRPRRDSFDFFADICREIAHASGLTNSEYRVLRKIVEGASNNEICRDFGISLATVKTHISHILQKTNCRNRADLIGTYFSSKKAIAR